MRLNEIFESDDNIIDFGRAKAKKQTANNPDAQYLKAMSVFQNQRKDRGWEPETAKDVAMDLAVRNIHHNPAMGGKGFDAWSNEDQQAYHNLMYGSLGIKRTVVQQTVQQIAKAEGYIVNYPDQRTAYIKNKPHVGKYNITDRNGKLFKMFDFMDDMYIWILNNWADKHPDIIEPKQNEIDSFIEMYNNLHSDDHGVDKNFYMQGIENFNPDDFEKDWEGNEVDSLTPSIEKYIEQYSSYSENKPWIMVNKYDGIPYMEFHSSSSPSRKKEFSSLKEMDRWIRSHKAAIELWYNKHLNKNIDLPKKIRAIGRVISSLYNKIINKTEDETEILKKAETLSEYVDALIYQTNSPILKKIREDLLFDLLHPNTWKFLDDDKASWVDDWIKDKLK